MITVREAGDKIVVYVDGEEKLSLTKFQAVYLLRLLASKLGYRITMGKPAIVCHNTVVSVLECTIAEGTGEITVSIPVKHVKKIEEIVLSELSTRTRITKRELAEKICRETKVCSGWPDLFSDRKKYYTFFRAPLILLEQRHLIKTTKKYVKRA